MLAVRLLFIELEQGLSEPENTHQKETLSLLLPTARPRNPLSSILCAELGSVLPPLRRCHQHPDPGSINCFKPARTGRKTTVT